MEKQVTPQLNSLVIENIFSYLEEHEKDRQTFRLINRLWSTESLKLWRKSATVIIQSGVTNSGQQFKNNFLDEFTNISEDKDPNKVIRLPFRRYKIIISCFIFPPFCAESRFSNVLTLRSDHLCPSPEFNNFWRLCASNITHLEIKGCKIQSEHDFYSLLTSLLFKECPSLKKLSLYMEEICWPGSRRTSPSRPSRSSHSLQSFELRTPSDDHSFKIWIDLSVLQEIFAIFPKIKELKLEENAVQMLKALKFPVTPTAEYINLGKVVIKFKDQRKYSMQPFSFFSLTEYVQVVNPPLNQMEASVYLKDVRIAPNYDFHAFFTYWGTHLTHLVLNLDVKDDNNSIGFLDNHFTDLSGRNFQQLTHFHLNFVNDSKNISFDFGALRKMPELKIFRCGSDTFKNIRSYKTDYGYLMKKKRDNDKDLEYSGTIDDWNQNLEAVGKDQIILQNLTEFSFRLNYKFGKESLQKLKIWAENIRNLEIVVDDEKMFLDFLGKEFQWWPHSLDKLVLHCETDLDTEEIKKAIRGEQGRPVEMQFCQLEKAPYPLSMYRLV